jgi:23S rRNA (cytosine1962-C5)-methyltransferase
VAQLYHNMHHFSKVILKKGKEESLLRFHPWVFSGAINNIEGPVEEGDVVTVFSSEDKFLGIGHCAIGTIAVRIFSFQEVTPDLDFWTARIQAAYNLRERIGLTNDSRTNVFRLVHGEGDNLPGLIIDFYNGTAVFQAHTVGMWLIRDMLVEALKAVLVKSLKAVYDKSSKTLPFKASVEPVDGYLFGDRLTSEVIENGNRLLIDWEDGQKTGFYIDQRENRKILGEYSHGKYVLNMFCYTGGFSAYALQGGAKLVHSVDASESAIEMTNKNIELNFPGDSRHETFAADAFDYMQEIKDKYDLIVLDPPAFAKHKNALNQALQGYKRLNLRAFQQIRPGGIIFTFSCSQVVTKTNFREAVFSAAAISKRNVRILQQLTQPGDHPINIYHPEGEYLKGLVLYVE